MFQCFNIRLTFIWKSVKWHQMLVFSGNFPKFQLLSEFSPKKVCNLIFLTLFSDRTAALDFTIQQLLYHEKTIVAHPSIIISGWKKLKDLVENSIFSLKLLPGLQIAIVTKYDIWSICPGYKYRLQICAGGKICLHACDILPAQDNKHFTFSNHSNWYIQIY